MEEFIKQIKSDQEVKEFINKLETSEIEDNICLLLEQVRANNICNNCLGKKECLSDVNNMQSYLVKNGNLISREYYDCSYKKFISDDNLETMFIPNNLEIKEEDMDITIDRTEFIKAMQEYKNTNKTKGVYLYGTFGTGKTYLMLQLANIFIKKNKKVLFAYYPELVRHAKSTIGDGSLEKLIVKLKNVDVLMLDDIGAEVNSAFLRDEFLGPILNYRYNNNLPIFMTSNYSISELKNHFENTKDSNDPIGASRIIERISFTMNPINLKGENYRRKEK